MKKRKASPVILHNPNPLLEFLAFVFIMVVMLIPVALAVGVLYIFAIIIWYVISTPLLMILICIPLFILGIRAMMNKP